MDDLDHKFKTSAENFSLSPSNESWMKVESALQRKNRRRKFIIFFLLGFTMLSGYYFFNRNGQAIKTDHSTTNDVEKTTAMSNPDQKSQIENSGSSQAKSLTNKTTTTPPDNKHLSESNHSTKNISKKIYHQEIIRHETKKLSQAGIASTTKLKTTDEEKILASNGEQVESQVSLNTTPIEVIPRDSSHESNTGDDQVNKIKDTTIFVGIDSLKKDSLATKTDSLPDEDHGFRWSISLGAAPTMSASTYKEQGDYQILANYRDSSDKNLLTMNYKLLLHYKLSNKVELFSGVGIRNFKQELLSHQAVYKYDTNTNVSVPFPVITVGRAYSNLSNDSIGVVKNNFTYLEIPLGVSYNLFTRGKFNLSLDGQIGMNKLISTESYKYEASSFTYKKSSTSDLKPWIFSFGLGLSARQFIAKRISLEFSPAYHRFQNSIFKSNQPLELYVDQAELNFSIRYFIK
jgi:hypothetical protein